MSDSLFTVHSIEFTAEAVASRLRVLEGWVDGGGRLSTGTVFDGELSKVLDGRGYGRFREAA
jgi:hypothetical protein